jgi:Putative sensor
VQQEFFEIPRQQAEQQRQELAVAPQGAEFARHSARRSLWLAILYMLTAFPLGTFYFTFLVTAFSMGVGLLVVWIGLPILFFTLLAWLGMAAFERWLTMRWLNVYIPPMMSRPVYGASMWRRFLARMSNPATWKSLVYLFVKFPFGIMSFTVTISLFVTSIGLIVFPLAYLIDTALVAMKAFPAHIMGNVFAYQVVANGQIQVEAVLVTVIGTVAGIGLFLVSRYVMRCMAFLWGAFARVMLSQHSAGEPLD